MPHKIGQAGKSTREMAKRRRRSVAWIVFIGFAVLGILWLFLRNSKVLGIGGVGVLILLALVQVIPGIVEGRADRKFIEEKRAIRGAKAEESIGELLAGLSDDYYVLNDIKSPYGNIDHIVIGKNAGIFLLETKAHGGKVDIDGETLLVNGKLPEKDFIAQTLQNTYWLRDEISQIVVSKPWITPIIVFTNAFVSSPRLIKGVSIVNKKYLLGILYKANKPNAVNAQVWEQKENIVKRLI